MVQRHGQDEKYPLSRSHVLRGNAYIAAIAAQKDAKHPGIGSHVQHGNQEKRYLKYQ